MPGKKIIIIGPGYPLRGGLANFNQRLCRQFMEEGHDCCIYSFSLQYPSFLFPGTTQYSNEPRPEGLEIYSIINSIHPFNWWQVGNALRRIRPDIILVCYWLPFMAPAFGTILKRIRKNKHTRIIALTHNVVPHEKRPGDERLTHFFVRQCDGFITMSEKVMNDLRHFDAVKPARLVPHPLYDHFGERVSKTEARNHLGLPPRERILLFFGIIRKYKGLDILLDAVKLIDPSIKLMVAGEFYEDAKPYREQIKRLHIENRLILKTDFIPDSELKYYLCAADVVIQPYRNATQSGVTPLAYHFEKPMIVTNVGGLPGLVPHEQAGLVCQPEPASLAAAVNRYFELGEQHFIPHLRSEKKKYSWHNLAASIEELAQELQESNT
jgi:Glycosyltransferase